MFVSAMFSIARRNHGKNIQILRSRQSPRSDLVISFTLRRDFRHLTVISDNLKVISDILVRLSPEKNIVGQIDSIMGARAEQSSP